MNQAQRDIQSHLVGVAAPPFRGVVEYTKVVEYAQAIHIRNPIYFDREAAIAAGYRNVVVPPGFINPFSLQPRSAKFETFGINEKRAVAGEWSWEQRLVICAGDELHGQSVLVEFSEKQGTRPKRIFVIETTYSTDDCEAAIVVRDTTIEFKE
ncbi:MaoC family dehydratase N-terminal domain-containing protein [Cupriavidus sp. 2MCAB6]|uniref:FAS1-like dehydratase domain-containing protein n=1 Tax=Cupriavidus sp. 2MCAB6 TaxID=3232981 RepID=UPI003F8E5854